MILLPQHRVKNAFRFVESDGDRCWMILGQTDPWTNEAAPPIPDPTSVTIYQKFVAVKCTAQVIFEDGVGPIFFTDSNGDTHQFTALTDEDEILTDGTTLVMVRGTVSGADVIGLGVSSFRTVGFATQVTGASGHESDTVLAAANVASWGVLESVENRTPIFPDAETSYQIENIFMF